VDGKVRKSPRYPIGLFEVITFVKSGESYRLMMNNVGSLTLVPVQSEKAHYTPARVITKSFAKGITRLHMLNGRTIVYDKKDQVCVGDTIVFDKNFAIKE